MEPDRPSKKVTIVGHRPPALDHFTLSLSRERYETERKKNPGAVERSKEPLFVSEVKYRNLIEAAPGAISVIENGKVIFCNSHF